MAAPVRVRRCTQSFKRDARSHGLTNVADVTQDQANQRAGYAPLRRPARVSKLISHLLGKMPYKSVNREKVKLPKRKVGRYAGADYRVKFVENKS
jgi:hypothetical protein